jgi:mannan endo-1,4-beta-mannosidase
MKKINFAFSCIILILSSLAVQSQRTTMYVNGRYLYTAANEKVILRGVNEMYWGLGDRSGAEIIGEIAKTGANSVRIGWITTVGTVTEFDNAINNCINNKMIPVGEMHDATGDFNKVQTCLNFWKRSDVVAVINKHKKWFILNIANEAGDGSVTDDQYKAKYKDAISQLRNAGIEVPLLIDAAEYGNNIEQVIRCWSEIFNSDPIKSVMFSGHTYWNSNHQSRLDNAINSIVSANIPVMFGESPTPTAFDCTTSPYAYFLQKFQQNEIGWQAWSWGKVPNGDCKPANGRSLFDITTDGKFGNWSPNNPWAVDITINSPNSIKNTSIRPASITGLVGNGGSKAEAENGTLTGVTAASSIAGFSGSGYIEGSSLDATGDAFKVTINVSGGTYPLNIRYNGRFGEKYQDVYVNGNYLGSIQFPASGSWATKTISNVNLTAGNNTVEIRKGWGWMDFDYIEAGGSTGGNPTNIKLEAETGSTLTGVATANGIAGYSGSGYTEGSSLDANGDNIKIYPQISTTGSYSLGIRYNGRFGEKYQDVYVNGAFYGYIQFPAFNGWTTKAVGNVNLNAGGNTIELRKNWGWIDVDYFTIGSAAPSSANATIISAIENTPLNNKLITTSIRNNRLFIDATAVLEATERADMRLFDTDGKLVYQWQLTNNQKEWMINKPLHAGVYILQITTKKGKISKKLIAE